MFEDIDLNLVLSVALYAALILVVQNLLFDEDKVAELTNEYVSMAVHAALGVMIATHSSVGTIKVVE